MLGGEQVGPLGKSVHTDRKPIRVPFDGCVDAPHARHMRRQARVAAAAAQRSRHVKQRQQGQQEQQLQR
jgi:hypothetical protein